MIWPYKIGIIAAMIFAAALSGFFYGRSYEREAVLKQAVQAYQNANEVQNEVNRLSDYALCIALGGLPKQCQVFLRGLDEASSNQ